MPRLVGVDIPDNKRIVIALTYIYGVGEHTARLILKEARIDESKRARDLDGKEIALLQRILDKYPIEGTLRKQVRDDIDRLRQIGSYRGQRHTAGLPARGQRTRVNARTRRGRKMTVGALKKEDMAKLEQKK